MIWRIARLIVRIAGWLLTPIVIAVTAAAAALLAAVASPRFSTSTALATVGISGMVGGIIGTWLWLKLLRGSPELRQALAVTPQGVPEGQAVEQLLHPDRPSSGGGPS
jgi:hypothetical protein